MPLKTSQRIFIFLIICVCASIGDFTDADHLDEENVNKSSKTARRWKPYNKTLRWTTDEFLKQGLDKVNELRKLHKAPDMTLDKILSWDAEEYASKVGMHMEEVLRVQPFYSHVKNTGENVWVSDNQTTVTGDVPVQFWYAESSKHNFDKNVFSFSTAQFTQLIWKGSKTFGMGMALSPVKKHLVVVARFKPNGNFNYTAAFSKHVERASA